MQKFPAINLDEKWDVQGLYDKKAGLALCQNAFTAFKDLSLKAGAELQYDAKVVDISNLEK